MPPELWAMKPGRMSDGLRFTCDSIDTTAPMCGAIAPVAPPGLRAICAHVWPSWCTAAHARPGRTRTSLSRWSAVFGIRPRGKRIVPLENVSGEKSDGVQAPSFRSHVSMLLGAPERKMKMQFFAVLRSETFGAAVAP